MLHSIAFALFWLSVDSPSAMMFYVILFNDLLLVLGLMKYVRARGKNGMVRVSVTMFMFLRAMKSIHLLFISILGFRAYG